MGNEDVCKIWAGHCRITQTAQDECEKKQGQRQVLDALLSSVSAYLPMPDFRITFALI